MGKHAALTLLLLLPSALHAQATGTDRTITVTASRNATVAPDLGVITVDVVTPTDAALDDVLAAAQGSIVTAANFTSVSTVNRLDSTGKTYHDYLDWGFTLTTALSNLKATLGQLTALQVAVGTKNNGMTVFVLAARDANIRPGARRTELRGVGPGLRCAGAGAEAGGRGWSFGGRGGGGVGNERGHAAHWRVLRGDVPALLLADSEVRVDGALIMRRQLMLLLAAAATAIAQTDTNTITITASRNVAVPPDQAVYSVSVRTDSSASLSDATTMVAEAGIKAANLSYTSGYGATVVWEFTRVVPFSSMKDTNVTLAKLIKQAGPPGPVPSISYSVTSVSTSQAAQSQACQFSALVSDARREAERLAAAAGVHVGAIVGLSEQPELSAAITAAPFPGNVLPVIVPSAVSRAGDFGVIGGLSGIPVFALFLAAPQLPPPQPTPCRMVVQFRLLP
jgi:uncharacterized protein YggE